MRCPSRHALLRTDGFPRAFARHGGPVLAAVAVLFAATAAAKPAPPLDDWFDARLVPEIRRQLETLPRFRDQALRFVVLRDGAPAAGDSALALELRDRLQAAVGTLPGVRIAWPPGGPTIGIHGRPAGTDCTRYQADYLIGVEVTARGASAHVAVTATELASRAQVAGFGGRWHGTLDARQQAKLRTPGADPTMRGERDAPWTAGQADLLAATLARRIGCDIARQTHGEYVVGTATSAMPGLVELVTNNLAGVSALRFTGDDDEANAFIEGKAHLIDDDLYQYWITIRPRSPGGELLALGADAYVTIGDRHAAAAILGQPVVELPDNPDHFLTSLSVVEVDSSRRCLRQPGLRTETGGYDRGRDTCLALQVLTDDDAALFFLNHPRNSGLVRLADARCDGRISPQFARDNERAEFPLPQAAAGDTRWSTGEQWSVEPAGDTYYVLASRDSTAARALARHLARLPDRCGTTRGTGLEGDELVAWLDDLARISRRWPDAIDWQSIQVRTVY